LTGAEDRRIRDIIRERFETPPVVRLVDKASFLFGVIGCALIEYAVLQQPHNFSSFYMYAMIPLLCLRLWLYTQLKWHYFLLDFCYAANLACLVQVLLFPTSPTLIMINYVNASGPLALAIPTWRNSLVFHSLDKITSTFLHTLPALLLFCTRWYPPPGYVPEEQLSLSASLGGGLAAYMGWQALYLLHTEVVFRHRLSSHRDLMTSIRWLTTTPYSGITLVVHRLLRGCGVLAPDEMFNSEQWKTKLIFIAVQFVYTAVTMLPVHLLWASFRLHLGFLLAIYGICVWNGASYYIEVFSKAYRKKFEGDEAARRAAMLEALEAPGFATAAPAPSMDAPNMAAPSMAAPSLEPGVAETKIKSQ